MTPRRNADAGRMPSRTVLRPAQINRVNRTTATHSLPTRARSTAKPGIRAAAAAHARAGASSPSASRAMRKISGMESEATSAPSHLSRTTWAARLALAARAAAGVISQ